ncbi:MAG: acylneuraminate cytidylyltransferase family protein [Lachnospiraceae bacterium]|nr:acylneuraminate cytidylyltransferase family protein [Lachnospiraceae bacterium]
MGRYCNVYALIPARSGSKSVKDKNIRIMDGKPMIAYSILDALGSKYIEKVIVSTDSEEYAGIARKWGAEVPFLRPADISGDNSMDIEVFQHFIDWMISQGYDPPEIIVHLRPTHPIRNIEDIDKMVSIMIKNPELDAIRSVAPVKETPYKMWQFNEDGILTPLVTCDIPEAYNAPRQILPQVYMQNACIDVIRTSTIIDKHSMTGSKIAGYKMNYDFDIDTEDDFIRAEQHLAAREKLKSGGKLKIVCDIDGVIAQKTPGNHYDQADPNYTNIIILKRLHELGHRIVLHTARGYSTGIDWVDLTKKQMNDWGVPYDDLVFGKPDADFYIDDKLSTLNILGSLCE